MNYSTVEKIIKSIFIVTVKFMRIISTSYSKTFSFNDPHKWLRRISFYTGILEELAMEHEVISLERINYSGEVYQNNVRYLFIEQKNEVETFPYQAHTLIRKFSPDIILVNGFIFPFQLIQLRLQVGKSPGVLVINRSEKPGTGLRRWLQKLADRFVTAYLFPSELDGKKWVEKGIIKNSNKIKEVMHASSNLKQGNKNLERERAGIDGDPLFLWVGRLDANKDPLTVVKAFITFLQTNPGARLYMIFQENEMEEEISNTINEAKAEKNIVLAGKKDHSQLVSWYNAADFIISGSHAEGGGIAIMEAMSCGCIPILTKIPSFIKMTDNGRIGMLYEAGNPQALHSLLLLSTAMDIESESIKVVERFKSEFSFKAIAQKINAIIRNEK